LPNFNTVYIVAAARFFARRDWAIFPPQSGRTRPQSQYGIEIMRLALAFSLAASVVASSFAVCSPADARQTVNFRSEYSAGTVVIRHSERRLYYVMGGGKAIAYPVGVGRAGKGWYGTRFIDGKRLKPAWSPPAEVRRDNPRLPTVIPGGSPRNPMGVAALTLSGGEYAIHGTNAPGSVGGFVSYGCIRMHNSDILDLFGRVGFGTRVVVTR
jgi:lipoprotein-anchoring transpeptidase ErfK/SrfK